MGHTIGSPIYTPIPMHTRIGGRTADFTPIPHIGIGSSSRPSTDFSW